MIQPRFVLVRPQMAENIGAAARAMLNFGLEHMSLVAPRDGWPSPKAVAMASGAGRLLDGARLVETTAEAISEATFVVATTARPRELTKPVLSPEAAMAELARRATRAEHTAVLFGPERAGLENDDIARANAIVSVPVNPDFPSLNLAQCVLLLSYEWRRQTEEIDHESLAAAGDMATQREIEALSAHYEDSLAEAGFFFPDHKAPAMKRNLRNLWSRLPLTRADIQMLHGILRQMARRRGRG